MAEAATSVAKPTPVPVSREREGQGEQQNPISLPMFIMMLETAVVLDLMDIIQFIPFVGNAIAIFFSVVFGSFLLVLIWASGARQTKQLVTMGLGFVAEKIPVVSVLPLNTIMVILVIF